MTINPPRWTDDELRNDIEIARETFLSERRSEGAAFNDLRSEVFQKVSDLFELTTNLTDITATAVNVDPDFRWYLGYCSMPPTSADDLRTMTGSPLRRQKLSGEDALGVIKAIEPVLDQQRFPWLAEARHPSLFEKRMAIEVTAALIASERMKTRRRNQPAAIQQNLVSETLIHAGYREVAKPARISSLDQLNRGEFCGETLVGPDAAKADRPVRLHDGRLLAIGCKVTNSSINSRKRLLKDIASDAASWRGAFGGTCIPAAVISGVIDLATLQEAQNQRGTFIVWQHNMQPLSNFVNLAV